MTPSRGHAGATLETGVMDEGQPVSQQHNRASWRDEQLTFEGGDLADTLDDVEGGEHDGERFLVPMFAQTQVVNGAVVGGVTRQVIPPQPLDGHDAPSRSSATARSSGSHARSGLRSAEPASCSSTSVRRGPHAGHEIVCA